jgi:nucleoside-diphosphate-sugar epimerase
MNFETTNPKPINSYGQSKFDLECYLNATAASKVCNLRISNVFGDPKFNDILNRILDGILNKKSIDLVSPKSISRDFISIGALIGALKVVISLSESLAKREVINISSGESTTLYSLLNIVENLGGSKTSFVELSVSNDLIERSVISNSKMNTLLNHEIKSQSLELQKYIQHRLGVGA